MSYALQNGYRLVDGAYCYGNEDEVGKGLREAFATGVRRENVFVVSKVWTTYATRVELGLDKSLKSLGLDYVDLFLVVSTCSCPHEEMGQGLTGRPALAVVDEPRW